MRLCEDQNLFKLYIKEALRLGHKYDEFNGVKLYPGHMRRDCVISSHKYDRNVANLL